MIRITEITPSELKLIYLEIVMLAIIGVLVFLYNSQPIDQSYNINKDITNKTQVSSSNTGWIVNLMPSDAGIGSILSNPGGQLIIVISIFIIPLTIMNSIVAIRFIADLVKGIL